MPRRIYLRPHHAHVGGAVRNFYLNAGIGELAESFLEEFSTELALSPNYEQVGGTSDVIGDTPEEFRGFVRRLVHFNQRIHAYPGNLPVEIMATKKDPLCRLGVKRRHCNDYRKDEQVSLAEESTAEEICDHINYFSPGGANLRRSRRPNRVAVETTWGALTKYWRLWETVADEIA